MSADGGPAFPGPNQIGISADGGPMYSDPFCGMSLRDYFAAQAIAASVDDVRAHVSQGFTSSADHLSQEIATSAYLLADAMLKARESK